MAATKKANYHSEHVAKLLMRLDEGDVVMVTRLDRLARSAFLRKLAVQAAAAGVLAPSKGRLIRCTVPGLTPNRAAILRTPSVRPGAFKAARIRFSSSAAIGGRPSRLPSLLARASPARTRS
jgi:hypothetical protein